MIDGIKKIIRAVKLRNYADTKERKDFRQKQQTMYQEQLIRSKFETQIQDVVNQMRDQPDLVAVRISVDDKAQAIAETVMDAMGVQYTACANPNEFIIARAEETEVLE